MCTSDFELNYTARLGLIPSPAGNPVKCIVDFVKPGTTERVECQTSEQTMGQNLKVLFLLKWRAACTLPTLH